MKTVDIKGRPYIEVNQRIIYFRANYPDHKLISEIVSLENGVCLMKALVLNKDNEVIAVGHAYEKEGSTFINKTSYIENCETSAWGRALGNMGIGVDTSIASADEVENAIENQKKKPSKQTKPTTKPVEPPKPITATQITTLNDLIKLKNINLEKLLTYFKIKKIEDIKSDQYGKILQQLNKKWVGN